MIGLDTAARRQRHRLAEAEERLLQTLRSTRRSARDAAVDGVERPLSMGQRFADAVAATMGSWRFIIIQTTLLLAWVCLNVVGWMSHWDPYPFILLNLTLSFQAAYAAPFIMMSQNRQQDIDRQRAESDYQINIKAELEIELLHQKIDELREKEILMLTRAVSDLTARLKAEGAAA